MEDGVHSLTKIITLKAGKSISYQLHNHRSETWNIIEGEGVLVLNGEVRKVKRGDVVTIPCGYKHTIKAYTQLSFVEVQLGRLLTEDDIDRFDFDWSLVDKR
jgi:mannose-1-phosphate guanylyltransferase